MPSSDQVVIDLIDVTGRKLIELYNGNLAGGPQRIDLPISTLRSGVYMVRSQHGDRSEMIRFVVE